MKKIKRHPSYQQSIKIIELNKFSVKELESFFKEFSIRVNSWTNKVKNLRENKQILLFFNSKQILSLLKMTYTKNYTKLSSFLHLIFSNCIPQKSIAEILEFNSITCPIDALQFESDLLTIKSAKEDKIALKSIEELGDFLNNVNNRVNSRSKLQNHPLDFKISPSTEFNDNLARVFLAINFSNEQIFKLLIYFYKDRDQHPKEIFYCSHSTTYQDLIQQLELIAQVKNGR